MHFTNRKQAGTLLAEKLKDYKKKDVIVYALPRGGVVTALAIAKYLNAPLDLIITRKIGHPNNAEYAIATIAETGDIVGNFEELTHVDKYWLKSEILQEKEEIKRRKALYLKGREKYVAKGKIAIIVDDGVATGLTLRAGIKELKRHHPLEIIVAVPIIPKPAAEVLKKEIDELVALTIPSDDAFAGSVGAYYEQFPQVSDAEVIDLLNTYQNDNQKIFIINKDSQNMFFDYDEP